MCQNCLENATPKLEIHPHPELWPNQLHSFCLRNLWRCILHDMIPVYLCIQREKIGIKVLRLHLQHLWVRTPGVIPNKHPMNFVPLPPDNCLCMEESSISVTKSHPILPGFLKPHEFFL